MNLEQIAAKPELRKVTVPILSDDLEIRASASGDGSIHFVGHAAVFDRLSQDLGGFKERVQRGAFSKVLDSDPDVHLVIGHDMTKVLARTRSKTLELREDPKGLRVWANLDPEDPDVKSLVPKMKRGDIDQMSFGFFIEEDDWDLEDGTPVRTIRSVWPLFEVSVVAQGAYPQTDAGLRSVLDAAIESGRIPLLERANSEVVAETDSSTEIVADDPGESIDLSDSTETSNERKRRLALARARVRVLTI
jgi:HK97 family phage prohead protease